MVILIRVKVPSGVKLMPHRHPEDRIYTVMSGVFYIGLGDQFDGAGFVRGVLRKGRVLPHFGSARHAVSARRAGDRHGSADRPGIFAPTICSGRGIDRAFTITHQRSRSEPEASERISASPCGR